MSTNHLINFGKTNVTGNTLVFFSNEFARFNFKCIPSNALSFYLSFNQPTNQSNENDDSIVSTNIVCILITYRVIFQTFICHPFLFFSSLNNVLILTNYCIFGCDATKAIQTFDRVLVGALLCRD